MAKMPCHITDGPSDPEDAQDRDFAEYQEEFTDERQARLDERRGIQLRVSMAIDQLTKHNTFSRHELQDLLKRISRYLADESPV
jgi:hypothetical protein